MSEKVVVQLSFNGLCNENNVAKVIITGWGSKWGCEIRDSFLNSLLFKSSWNMNMASIRHERGLLGSKHENELRIHEKT